MLVNGRRIPPFCCFEELWFNPAAELRTRTPVCMYLQVLADPAECTAVDCLDGELVLLASFKRASPEFAH